MYDPILKTYKALIENNFIILLTFDIGLMCRCFIDKLK